MTFVLNYSIYLSILSFVLLYGDNFKVEARPKEVVPVPGWFNNVEGFVLPNLKAFESTEPTYINKHLETDEIITPIKRKKNRRKRKRIVKKTVKKFKKGDRVKKKKHNSSGHRLKFIKSDINENDIKDSNLSVSKEMKSQRKPVDIIVHIKMNE